MFKTLNTIGLSAKIALFFYAILSDMKLYFNLNYIKYDTNFR